MRARSRGSGTVASPGRRARTSGGKAVGSQCSQELPPFDRNWTVAGGKSAAVRVLSEGVLLSVLLSTSVRSRRKTARLGRFRIWKVGGDGRIRTGDRGFADPRLNHLATSPRSREPTLAGFRCIIASEGKAFKATSNMQPATRGASTEHRIIEQGAKQTGFALCPTRFAFSMFLVACCLLLG